MGLLGAISAAARGYLREPEKSVYNPNSMMQKVYKNTHYIPIHWNGHFNTYKVRDEFLEIFVYKFTIFLYDLMSVVTTPYLLLFVFPNQSVKIVDFIKTHTVDTSNIGPICVFAQYDNKSNNKKMEESISGFIINHSIEGESNMSISTIDDDCEDNIKDSGIHLVL
jgi:autophagy-related protein 9